VLTSKHSYGPSQDWLKITQTSQAKNKIKQFFKKQRRDENISKGKELVEKEIRALNIEPKEVLIEENLNRVFQKFNFSNEDDMYAAVGYQGITAASIATRLTEKIRETRKQEQILIQKENKKENTRAESKKRGPGVRVKGMDNLLVRIAKCCNPVPGDEIVGYITKGRGVSVHRKDCPNVKTEEAKERYIEVEWNQRQDFKNQYQVDLEITGFNRRRLVNEVLHEIYEAKTNISYVNAKVNQNKIAI